MLSHLPHRSLLSFRASTTSCTSLRTNSLKTYFSSSVHKSFSSLSVHRSFNPRLNVSLINAKTSFPSDSLFKRGFATVQKVIDISNEEASLEIINNIEPPSTLKEPLGRDPEGNIVRPMGY